jgi:PKD repeat protein
MRHTQSTLRFIISGIFILLFASFTGNRNQKTILISGGELTFSVRTVTQNGTYAPKHVLAIWVEDAGGFVKTRKAMANQRKQYLYTWKAASNYNVVDAITGPTLTSHQTHTVSWNCTDLNGGIVPDGEYTIWVEFTEKHAQGPLYSINFTKGPNAQSITPPDQTYFKDIQLEFVPLVADFSSDVSEICQGDSVIFTDLSVGATSWNWNFGDGGSPASANTIGTHIITYNSPGAKTISLTINGSLTETKSGMITVNASPTAEFSFSGIEYTVEFTNNSANATSYLWEFGDGATSNEINPLHTYSGAGTYTVSLTASYINCNVIVTHDVSLPIVGMNYFAEIHESVLFYPNPTHREINYTMKENISGNISISIFNAMGQQVYISVLKGMEENKNGSVDLSGFQKGIYFIKLESPGFNMNQKIMLH